MSGARGKGHVPGVRRPRKRLVASGMRLVICLFLWVALHDVLEKKGVKV